MTYKVQTHSSSARWQVLSITCDIIQYSKFIHADRSTMNFKIVALFLVAIVAVESTSGCPNIISRAGWGARNRRRLTYMTTPVDHFVVHHSGVVHHSCDDVSSCSRVVRGIQNHHMNNNKWWDIGYNFLIGGDGNVYEGRGWNVVGAHAGVAMYNNNGIGVCMLGDFTSSMPTQAALDALDELVGCCVSRNKLKRNYIVLGHRDVKSTSCPGNQFYNYVTRMQNYGV